MIDAYSLTEFRLLNSSIEDINSLSLERAMNLPDYFQSNDVTFKSTELYNSLFSDLPRYVSILESMESCFEERYLAASILNVVGDTRITPLNPPMVDIPESQFNMGVSRKQALQTAAEFADIGVKEEWILKETPMVPVKLAAYKIAKYPVTNSEYKMFMDDNVDGECPPSWKYRVFPTHLANHPVHSISVEAINAYISWLNQKTEKSFRLPTEAEWEFAAKGNSESEYPWGDEFDKDLANTLESGLISTTPVGLFPKGKSPFGCLDMSGNVEEYTSSYYSSYEGDEVIMDDLYLESGPYRIARGGSYTRFRDLARTTRRHGKYDSDLYVMGFRLAEDG